MTYEIGGARGAIEDHEEILKKIHSWAESVGCDVLLADARVVFGRDHLETAVRHASRAQAAGTMAARSVSMEALRYLSGQRQVADAIRTAGIRPGTRGVAIAVFGKARLDEIVALVAWSRDDAVLEPKGKSLRTLGISEAESRTLPASQRPDLALEKVALLDLEK